MPNVDSSAALAWRELLTAARDGDTVAVLAATARIDSLSWEGIRQRAADLAAMGVTLADLAPTLDTSTPTPTRSTDEHPPAHPDRRHHV